MRHAARRCRRYRHRRRVLRQRRPRGRGQRARRPVARPRVLGGRVVRRRLDVRLRAVAVGRRCVRHAAGGRARHGDGRGILRQRRPGWRRQGTGRPVVGPGVLGQVATVGTVGGGVPSSCRGCSGGIDDGGRHGRRRRDHRNHLLDVHDGRPSRVRDDRPLGQATVGVHKVVGAGSEADGAAVAGLVGGGSVGATADGRRRGGGTGSLERGGDQGWQRRMDVRDAGEAGNGHREARLHGFLLWGAASVCESSVGNLGV